MRDGVLEIEHERDNGIEMVSFQAVGPSLLPAGQLPSLSGSPFSECPHDGTVLETPQRGPERTCENVPGCDEINHGRSRDECEKTRENPTKRECDGYITAAEECPRERRESYRMDARYLILVLLSLVVAASALTEEQAKNSEEWANKFEEMRQCLMQENVTEDEMRAFLFSGKSEDENEALKMTVYCFVKRINFFDGISWNMDVIAESEKNNPQILKLIKECLDKDDFTLPAHERAFQVQKCILEKGGLE